MNVATAVRDYLRRTPDLDIESVDLLADDAGAGVGLAAMLAGKWLGDPTLTEQGVALLDEDLARSVEHPGGADIMHGASGIILAALAAERYLSRPGRLETACRLGDQLISTAHREGQAWSWPESGETIGMNGFSHGAAGVAIALAELAVATGWDSYRQAAEHAVQHEQGWYDDTVENWPDLFPDSVPDSGRSPSFTWALCHGAPGIGLGRLRLWRLLNDPAHRRQAEQALAGTYKSIAAGMRQGNGNYSLCHGLAGNAELLIESGLRLGNEAALELARRLGREGIERYAPPSGNWPCGVDGDEAISPNLMLGWAGTGWFYLRLDDPAATPSLLSVDF